MTTLTANPAPCQEAPSPVQPMLFAPNELLRCGLSDAHSRPLVGERHAGGIRSWRESPATAWDKELIELSRTATSYAGLVFDCDSRQSVELAAASCVGCGPIPPPNFASERRASGHFHVGYFLGKPVHRGEAARARPLAFVGRIAEYYRAAIGSDPGYVGVLSYNPVHGDYSTTYPRLEPYGLDELAAVIPLGWRVPKVLLTAEGRNCSMFVALCRRGLRDTDLELEALAHRMNGKLETSLPASEVRAIVRSVQRYRARWRVRGHQLSFLVRQSKRGKRSGEAKRARIRERDLRIVCALDLGCSQRETAAAVGCSRGTVEAARGRLARGGLRTNTDRGLLALALSRSLGL